MNCSFIQKLKNRIWQWRNRAFLRKLRARNKNTTPSIICNNCIGGVIYHQLGLQFLTPTINLFIPGEDYLNFVKHFKEYVKLPVQDASNQFDKNYPVGKLTAYDLPTIHIHFQHYRTFEEARFKWEERCKRIQHDNLFFIWEFYESVYDLDLLHQFDALEKRLIAITHRPIPNIKKQFAVSCYNRDEKPIAQILHRQGINGKLFLNEWDYVSFLNDLRRN